MCRVQVLIKPKFIDWGGGVSLLQMHFNDPLGCEEEVYHQQFTNKLVKSPFLLFTFVLRISSPKIIDV